MKSLAFFLMLFALQQAYSQGDITISSVRNADNSVTISYSKYVPGTYCIYMDFTRLENASYPQKKFIARLREGTLVTLKPIDSNQGINYAYKYVYLQGEPDPKIDSTFVYLPLLPLVSARAMTRGWLQVVCNDTDELQTQHKVPLVSVSLKRGEELSYGYIIRSGEEKIEKLTYPVPP